MSARPLIRPHSQPGSAPFRRPGLRPRGDLPRDAPSVDQASTLIPDAYTSAEFHALSWIASSARRGCPSVYGRVREPGAYVVVDVAGRSLIVCRTATASCGRTTTSAATAAPGSGRRARAWSASSSVPTTPGPTTSTAPAWDASLHARGGDPRRPARAFDMSDVRGSTRPTTGSTPSASTRGVASCSSVSTRGSAACRRARRPARATLGHRLDEHRLLRPSSTRSRRTGSWSPRTSWSTTTCLGASRPREGVPAEGPLPLAGAPECTWASAPPRSHRTRRTAAGRHPGTIDARRRTTRERAFRLALSQRRGQRAPQPHVPHARAPDAGRHDRRRSRTCWPIPSRGRRGRGSTAAWRRCSRSGTRSTARTSRSSSGSSQGLADPAYTGGRMCYRFEESVHRFQNMVIDRMLALLAPTGDSITSVGQRGTSSSWDAEPAHALDVRPGRRRRWRRRARPAPTRRGRRVLETTVEAKQGPETLSAATTGLGTDRGSVRQRRRVPARTPHARSRSRAPPPPRWSTGALRGQSSRAPPPSRSDTSTRPADVVATGVSPPTRPGAYSACRGDSASRVSTRPALADGKAHALLQLAHERAHHRRRRR